MDENLRFDKVKDSQYSDTIRALVMAWDSKDADLIAKVFETSIVPLMGDAIGQSKMMMAFLNYAHSVTFGLATMMRIDVRDVVGMDAQADYQVQRMIMNGEINP